MDKREESTISKTSIEDSDLGKKNGGELLKGPAELSREEYNPASYCMNSHYFPSYGTDPCVNASRKKRSPSSEECIKNGAHH